VTIKQYYHTQETRGIELTSPIKCTRDDAWLGEAYYFWFDLADAEDWGNSSKRRKGYYDIYQSEINIENVLDTVFNEEHYHFWLKQIEKIARIIMAKTKMKPTLKELNDYLKERGTWNELHGIRFQDLPVSPDRLLIRPIEIKSGKLRFFQYRKRIQLAVYNSEIISKFTFLTTEKCI
jgi:hypothetical protein